MWRGSWICYIDYFVEYFMAKWQRSKPRVYHLGLYRLVAQFCDSSTHDSSTLRRRSWKKMLSGLTIASTRMGVLDRARLESGLSTIKRDIALLRRALSTLGEAAVLVVLDVDDGIMIIPC